jgi:hypothetical protein
MHGASTAQHSTAQHSTAQRSTAWEARHTAQCSQEPSRLRRRERVCTGLASPSHASQRASGRESAGWSGQQAIDAEQEAASWPLDEWHCAHAVCLCDVGRRCGSPVFDGATVEVQADGTQLLLGVSYTVATGDSGQTCSGPYSRGGLLGTLWSRPFAPPGPCVVRPCGRGVHACATPEPCVVCGSDRCALRSRLCARQRRMRRSGAGQCCPGQLNHCSDPDSCGATSQRVRISVAILL